MSFRKTVAELEQELDDRWAFYKSLDDEDRMKDSAMQDVRLTHHELDRAKYRETLANFREAREKAREEREQEQCEPPTIMERVIRIEEKVDQLLADRSA